MAYPIWITPAGSLGILPEAEFFQIQLDAYNPGGGSLTYSFISGQLPPGIQLTKTGSLQGVPIVVGATVPTNRNYEFSIRITNTALQITDRTFNMTISNIIPPMITPRIQNLGDFFDGTFFSLQLEATEVDPTATLTWSLANGSLPNGVTLSTSGLLSGFIYPLPAIGLGGETGYSNAPYNDFGYDNAAVYRNASYQFTVKVIVNGDPQLEDNLSYNLTVTSKGSFTADNDIDLISDNYITVDTDNIYIPIVTTPQQSLPTVRSNSNFAFQFSAIDPDNDSINFLLTTNGLETFDQNTPTVIGFDDGGFDQQTQALPPGLNIDPVTGWMSGHIPTQSAVTETFDFIVQAYKTDNPVYISIPETYTLTVLGNIENTITWTTSSDLGSIDNGSISTLSVSAVSTLGKPLIYSIAPTSLQELKHYNVTSPNLTSKMPQGLKLLPSGLIVGRATFEYFSLDAGTTTIDNSTATTFDDTYTFSVLAQSVDGTVSSIQTFTVRVNNFNKTPYENLYLKALPSMSQRETFLSIVNNTEIFPDELIYRPTDPWFGRAKDLRSLFLPGLTPNTLQAYADAMQTNHYNKRIDFGRVMTASAVDANFNTLYEVVYVPLLDTETYNGNSPANIDYVDYANFQGNVYPNSFQNMQSVMSNNLGYANQGALPGWMTSPQANQKVLGFTRAIVLAYTVPGASALIAYRLQANGVQFNDINFVADRYDLDNALTENFSLTTNSFIPGTETTFDRIYRVGTVAYTVDYALTGIPFNQINNQTLASIQALGGLDGVTDVVNGQTLVFAQQEYLNGGANEGWLFANATNIPGYTENLANPTIANERGGIWQVVITGNIVNLQFVEPVALGTQIQVNLGKNYASTIIFYNPALQNNQSVPAYSKVTSSAIPMPTTFDNNNTQFIPNRDVYLSPESGDSYLKFPKTSVLQ